MKKVKETQGITLVALVITIIILLILAGITISQLANNGLFGKSQEAKVRSENAIAKEEIELAKYDNQIDSFLDSNRGSVNLTQEEYNKFKRQGYKLLYEGNANTKKTYNFIEGTGDVKDYDFVVITFVQSPHGYGMGSYYFNTRDITKNRNNDIILTGYYDRHCYIHFVDNGFVVDNVGGEDNTYVYPCRIYGVNI